MSRVIRRSVVLGVLLGLIVQAAGFAATTNVSIVDFAFQPKTLGVPLGRQVQWTNNGGAMHTTTNDATNPNGSKGVGWWDSDPLTSGDDFPWIFTAAGRFTYHCEFHSQMTGAVAVPVRASPASGPVGTLFTIRTATINAPTGFVYDIQKKNPGGTFQNWKTGVKSASVTFKPAATGTYSFRARLRRAATGGVSGYSPARSVTVADGYGVALRSRSR